MSHPIGSAAPLRDGSRFDEGGWIINGTFARSDAPRDDKKGSVEKSHFAKSERNSVRRNLRGRSVVSQLATMTNDARKTCDGRWKLFYHAHLRATVVYAHLCKRDTNLVYRQICLKQKSGKAAILYLARSDVIRRLYHIVKGYILM